MIYATLLAGQYSHARDLLRDHRGVHEHRPSGCLPGRGTARGDVRGGAPGRDGRARAEHRPAEIRRRNFITQFPYQTPVGLVYDIGDYSATLESALKLAKVAEFPARKADAARRGKLRGLGLFAATSGPAAAHRRTSSAR